MIDNLQRRVQEDGRKSEEEEGRREERKKDLEEERERMDKDRIEKRNLQQMQKEMKRKEQEEGRKRREEEMRNEESRVEVIKFKMEEEKRKNGGRTEEINLKRRDEENRVKGEEERVEMDEQMDEELPPGLPEPAELKRLSWMKACPSWTKLSLLNKRKPGPSVRGHRRPQRAAGAPRLPPLSPQSLLQPTGVGSLTEVNVKGDTDDGFIALQHRFWPPGGAVLPFFGSHKSISCDLMCISSR